LRSSKQAISSLHQNNIKKANNLLLNANKKIKDIKKIIGKNNKLASVNAFSASLQEYAEAMLYLSYIKDKKLLPSSKLKIGGVNYLLGVCDLTGELGRRAVHKTIAGDYKEVYEIREFVNSIHKFFLTLNLRNGELRKKYDSIKWNLKKIEDIVYDIKTKGLD